MKRIKLSGKGVIFLALALALLLMLVSCDDEGTEQNNNNSKDLLLESGYTVNGNITSGFQILCGMEEDEYSIETERIPVHISFGIFNSRLHPEYHDEYKEWLHKKNGGIFVKEPRVEVKVIYNRNKDMEVLHSFTVDEFYENNYFYDYVGSEKVFQKEEIYYIDTARLISAYENGKDHITFYIADYDEKGKPMGHGGGEACFYYEIEDGYITFSTTAPPDINY